MTKLHQVLAVERRVKTEAQEERTQAQRALQNANLFRGRTRTYHAKDADGDTLPAVDEPVQLRVKDVLNHLVNGWTRKIDTIGEKHEGNMSARADIEVGGTALIENVPSTQLLFLEKELDDLRAIILAAPTISSDIRWEYNSDLGLHQSGEVEENRTAKVQQPITLAPATDKHAAQAQLVSVDRVVGIYKTRQFSGALTPEEKRKLLDRVRILQVAVKQARETANTVDTLRVDHGRQILDFIFDDIM